MNTLQSILDTASKFEYTRNIISYLRKNITITFIYNDNPDFVIIIADFEHKTYTLNISRTANSLQHNVDMLNPDSTIYSNSRIICS